MTAFVDTITPILPEVIVTLTACVVLVADGLMTRERARLLLPAITVAGLVLAFLGGPLAPCRRRAVSPYCESFNRCCSAVSCVATQVVRIVAL